MSTRAETPLRLRLLVLVLGLGLLCLGTALPEARADAGLARQHFDRGVVLYRQGQFEAALVEFERSQRLRASPGLHYNVGQAQRALRRYGQAHGSFQRYLADNADLPAPRRALVRQILEEIRPHLAWLRLPDLPAGATVRIDGRRVEARPDVPLALDAGSHVVEIAQPGGATRTEDVVAAPGQSLTVRASRAGGATLLPRAGPGSPAARPEASAASPAAPVAVVTVPGPSAAASRPFYRRWWFWTAVGVVVVGAVVAGAAAGASQGPSGTLPPGTHQFR